MQSTHQRHYESLLANSNVPTQQSNVIVNPIGELVNSIASHTNRNTQSTTNYYQTCQQSAYCQANQNLQTNLQTNLQSSIHSGVQSNIQPPSLQANLSQQTGHQLNQQQINQQNEWLQQPVSTSSSSTASTALLQAAPFQTTLTPSGLTTQLITPPKLSTSKLKSNSITIWPINRNNKTGQFSQPSNTVLNLTGCVNQPQLISKLNRSSFTHHLLTCALIAGIVTLLLIVISSVYIYSTCKFFLCSGN